MMIFANPNIKNGDESALPLHFPRVAHVALLAPLANLLFEVESVHVVQESGLVVGRETLFAVYLHIVEMGRSAHHAFLLPPHAGNTALPVVYMPALQFQRYSVLETDTADVSQILVAALVDPVYSCRWFHHLYIPFFYVINEVPGLASSSLFLCPLFKHWHVRI